MLRPAVGAKRVSLRRHTARDRDGPLTAMEPDHKYTDKLPKTHNKASNGNLGTGRMGDGKSGPILADFEV